MVALTRTIRPVLLEAAQPALGVRPLSRAEMTAGAGQVRTGYASQEGEEALVSDRAQRVAIELEDVDVTHLHPSARRSQPNRGRDVPQ